MSAEQRDLDSVAATSGRLAGRVALITGAGEGIGRAAARLFALEGAHVAALDVDEARLEQTTRLIQETGSPVLPLEVDVADAVAVDAAVAQTVQTLGRLDVLYNNAGVWLDRDTAVGGLDLDVWDRTLAVNLTGAMLCCRAALPHMIRSGGGSIINTSSPVALRPEPVYDAYTASKGGLISLTFSIAQYYGRHGIRANVLLPGPISTAMTRVAFSDERYSSVLLERIPLGRFGRPEEVAQVAVFLASDESSYVTGCIQSVDGGWIHGAP